MRGPLHSFPWQKSTTALLDNLSTNGVRTTTQRKAGSTVGGEPKELKDAQDGVKIAQEQSETDPHTATQKYRHVTLLAEEKTTPQPDIHGSIVIDGLVRSIRKQKRVAFASIADGSTLAPVQAVFSDPKLTERYLILATPPGTGCID